MENLADGRILEVGKTHLMEGKSSGRVREEESWLSKNSGPNSAEVLSRPWRRIIVWVWGLVGKRVRFRGWEAMV